MYYATTVTLSKMKEEERQDEVDESELSLK